MNHTKEIYMCVLSFVVSYNSKGGCVLFSSWPDPVAAEETLQEVGLSGEGVGLI